MVDSFTPRIIPEDGGADCTGLTETVTLVVLPRMTYTVDTSIYNGYNISCYGMSDGYIRITPTSVEPLVHSLTAGPAPEPSRQKPALYQDCLPDRILW